jgi:hypothetical protein
MESRIALSVGLKYHPVAILLAEEKPEDALQFKQGKWGCVMFMFANAAKGKTAAFDRHTYGCWGGGVGLGFGNAYLQFPGGVDCFGYFLSTGNSRWEKGRQVAEALKGAAGRSFAENFLEGEAYQETPELVEQFLQDLPMTEIDTRYVLFKPLCDIDPQVDTPATVVMVADANYARTGMENVIIPWAAGCQTIGILPFREAKAEKPRAVVGLTDISARKYVRNLLGAEFLTFAMPWNLFLDLEAKVEDSFLQRRTWRSLVADKR